MKVSYATQLFSRTVADAIQI
ncbi:unnamed protein product, partial [Allacma fusca]